MVRTSKESLPGWLPLANRIVRGLTRLGLNLGTIHVLTVPGRRSGEPRPTPVSPLTVDGRRYVVAALPQCDWARNARAAGRGQLARGRRSSPVLLTEVADPTVRREVLRAFPTEVPGGVPFFVRLGLVTTADPDQFATAADRVAVFQMDRDEKSGTRREARDERAARMTTTAADDNDRG